MESSENARGDLYEHRTYCCLQHYLWCGCSIWAHSQLLMEPNCDFSGDRATQKGNFKMGKNNKYQTF